MHNPARPAPWRPLLAVLAASLAGCTSLPPGLQGALRADAILLGEQHDAPGHQQLHRDTVHALVHRGQLAALALEMADQGTSTDGLDHDASEAAVRQALRWNDKAWPWAPYAPVVMAAVRAGVPVLGANLPQVRMRDAMADASLDGLLPAEALERQREAIRIGHCDLLPPARLAPMARIQVARDRAMAQTIAQAAKPGKTVVLVAGSGHVEPAIGVPVHLPAGLRAQSVTWPAAPPQRDYCAQLREQMAPRGGPASGQPQPAAP